MIWNTQMFEMGNKLNSRQDVKTIDYPLYDKIIEIIDIHLKFGRT